MTWTVWKERTAKNSHFQKKNANSEKKLFSRIPKSIVRNITEYSLNVMLAALFVDTCIGYTEQRD